MFGGLGMGELIIVFLVALLLFGAKRLPEIGSSLGKGIREFKGSLREIENEMKLPDSQAPRQVQGSDPPAPGVRRLKSEDVPVSATSEGGVDQNGELQ